MRYKNLATLTELLLLILR